jgi:cytochrome c biogenesis protein CcmG/thiol:disulfide interchange protein DsbE
VELPRLEPIWQKYREQGFTVVAVERRRDTERATKLIADNDLTYHFLENGEGDAEVVRGLFGVRVFPTSYLVDREGRIIFKHIGFSEGDEAELTEEVEKLLGT